jgi:hypothetical protein
LTYDGVSNLCIISDGDWNAMEVTWTVYSASGCTHENHGMDGNCTSCGEPVGHDYVDGKLNYAGLIEIDGDFYYVRSNGQLVTDRSYWITKNNDLLPAANYTFDENAVITNI